ncbi:MAG: alpha-ribazole phosphatase family protein [Bacteroidota bacterium]
MKIYLIRHTQPDVAKGICYGSTDLDVADSFDDEAAAVKAVLPLITPTTKILSSPLIRCRKLAEFIAEGHPIAVEPRLTEISFGDWEMQPWKSFGREVLLEWKANFVHTPCPNGESFQSVFDRAKSLYEEVIQMKAEQVFLVNHSGVIRAFLCLLTDIPLENAFDEQFGFGVVFEIEKGQVKRLK